VQCSSGHGKDVETPSDPSQNSDHGLKAVAMCRETRNNSEGVGARFLILSGPPFMVTALCAVHPLDP